MPSVSFPLRWLADFVARTKCISRIVAFHFPSNGLEWNWKTISSPRRTVSAVSFSRRWLADCIILRDAPKRLDRFTRFALSVGIFLHYPKTKMWACRKWSTRLRNRLVERFSFVFFFSSMDSARWHHWKLARQLSIAIAGDSLEIIPFGRSSFYWNWGERILKLFRFTEFKVVKGFFFTFLELFDFFGAEWTTS